MRELHLVGTDPDGALLLAADPDGPAAFRLSDVDAVQAALAARPGTTERSLVAVPARRRRPAAARPEASPAQLQARLRAGASPEALARETGTAVERVLRWAAPVQAEMADVLRAALAARVSGPDRESSATLGALVAGGAAGLDDDAVTWDVTRRSDGRWRVLLRVRAGARVTTASWVWDPRARTLRPASGRARQLSFRD